MARGPGRKRKRTAKARELEDAMRAQEPQGRVGGDKRTPAGAIDPFRGNDDNLEPDFEALEHAIKKGVPQWRVCFEGEDLPDGRAVTWEPRTHHLPSLAASGELEACIKRQADTAQKKAEEEAEPKIVDEKKVSINSLTN